MLMSLTFQETLFWIKDKRYSVLKTEKGVKDRTERRKREQSETGSLMHNCPLQTYSPKILIHTHTYTCKTQYAQELFLSDYFLKYLHCPKFVHCKPFQLVLVSFGNFITFLLFLILRNSVFQAYPELSRTQNLNHLFLKMPKFLSLEITTRKKYSHDRYIRY